MDDIEVMSFVICRDCAKSAKEIQSVNLDKDATCGRCGSRNIAPVDNWQISTDSLYFVNMG